MTHLVRRGEDEERITKLIRCGKRAESRIASAYHLFVGPFAVSTEGITSTRIPPCTHRQSGASSSLQLAKPRERSLSMKA